MPVITRSSGAEKYALELNGQNAGWVSTFSGGAGVADVITDSSGHKHIGAVKYEDIVLSCGTGMSRSFYEWVSRSSNMSGGAPRQDGAILACDYSNKVVSRLQWHSGFISAINISTLDAASRERGALTIKISPASTTHTAGDGGTVSSALSRPPIWQAGNFRLTIDGMEAACKWVSRVGTITISRETIQNSAGDTKGSEHEIGRASLSDLVITLAESRATPFYDWFDSFVIKGKSSAANEKRGTLELLDLNLGRILFTVRFSNLGIYQITSASANAGVSSLRKIDAKMYCGDINLAMKGAAM